MTVVDWTKGMLGYSHGLINFMITPLLPKIALDHVDLTGKTAVVTGANSGVGYEVAATLASYGARVVLACRDAKKAEKARGEIAYKSGNDKVYVEILDVASLESVKSFVERWTTSQGGKIDILVNNAGMSSGIKKTTKDGFESCYEVNLLSNFALVVPLLQRGIFASDARIINTSSQFMFESSALDPQDPNCAKLTKGVEEGGSLSTLATIGVYASAKAGVVVFTRELQDRLAKSDAWNRVTVQCYHPGIVLSEFWTSPTGISHQASAASAFGFVTNIIGISPRDASITPVFLATSPKATIERGKYWQLGNWRWTPGWMENAQLRQKLWARWEQDSGITASF